MRHNNLIFSAIWQRVLEIEREAGPFWVGDVKCRISKELLADTRLNTDVDEAKDLFPRKVRKAFLDQVTLFPINSYVILNNQSIGRVLRTNKKWTLRPTIELLYNSQGDKVEKPKNIRLMENPLLYIKGSINPNDLP